MNRHSEMWNKCPEKIISESVVYIHLNVYFVILKNFAFVQKRKPNIYRLQGFILASIKSQAIAYKRPTY